MAAGPDPIDLELVDAVNRGERAAFARLYERHRDFVHAAAWRIVGDGDFAAEVVQETFLWWLGRFPGFVLRAKATTFLYPVLRSVAITMARTRRRSLRCPLSEETQDAPAGPVPAPEGDPALAAAVARLPFGQQEVLLLRFGHGLELAEIAEALAVPLGTVKSRLHLAVRLLREDQALGSGR